MYVIISRDVACIYGSRFMKSVIDYVRLKYSSMRVIHFLCSVWIRENKSQVEINNIINSSKCVKREGISKTFYANSHCSLLRQGALGSSASFACLVVAPINSGKAYICQGVKLSI